MNRFDLFFNTYYQAVISDCFEDVMVQSKVRPFYQVLDMYLAKYHILKREVAKRCDIDRRTIYKIYHQENFWPTKRLVLCLGLGLRLSYEDFEKWLHDAGYHLSCHQKTDVVIMFCLKNDIYALWQVDLYLDRVGEKPLSGLK